MSTDRNRAGVGRLSGWVARSAGHVVDEGKGLLQGIWGDDDPDGVELESLLDVEDPELEDLDDPINDDVLSVELRSPGDARLPQVLGRLDPAPPLPLTEPFSAGLGPLLGRLIATEPVGVLADSRASKVLDMLGSRFTITVSNDGISIIGLLRTRDTPWAKVQHVELEERYDLFYDRVVAGSVAMLLGRGLLPIPGLSWLLRGVIGMLEQLVPNAWRDSMRHESGQALASIRRSMARDVELSGPLALVAFLSDGLTAAVANEAQRQNVLVRR